VTGRSAAAGSTTTIPEPGTEALQVNDSDMSEAVRAWWLAESDRRDRDLAARWRAWQEGHDSRDTEITDAYEEGFADGCLALKHAQHQARRLCEIEIARWGPGGREHFADPRPGDYIPAGAA